MSLSFCSLNFKILTKSRHWHVTRNETTLFFTHQHHQHHLDPSNHYQNDDDKGSRRNGNGNLNVRIQVKKKKWKKRKNVCIYQRLPYFHTPCWPFSRLAGHVLPVRLSSRVYPTLLPFLVLDAEVTTAASSLWERTSGYRRSESSYNNLLNTVVFQSSLLIDTTSWHCLRGLALSAQRWLGVRIMTSFCVWR